MVRRVKHNDHLALIADGVRGAGATWLELGAGDGEFTLALADLLGDEGSITAVDLDRWALARLERRLTETGRGTGIATLELDFRTGLPAGPFDGVLCANSLHFVKDVLPVLEAIRSVLAPGGRLVTVEYDADRGNPYVPHPISFARWRRTAVEAGFAEPRELDRVPSRFLGAIYGAVTTPH
jgi:ubiquinone/menaquinone biosynthesis C-methylase UbiE